MKRILSSIPLTFIPLTMSPLSVEMPLSRVKPRQNGSNRPASSFYPQKSCKYYGLNNLQKTQPSQQSSQVKPSQTNLTSTALRPQTPEIPTKREELTRLLDPFPPQFKQYLAAFQAWPYPKKDFARAHGVRTYEPREGRNAATAVCSASAVVSLAFLIFSI
jgi:hypothetical protein